MIHRRKTHPRTPTAASAVNSRSSYWRAARLCLLLAVAPLTAQMPATDPEPYRQAIHRIDFLVGEWRGEGWTMTGPNKREAFRSWEKVERRLGGAALLVEGRHFSMADSKDAVPAHHALATISWSERKQKYRFSSALFNRDGGEFQGFVDANGAFVWEISVPGRTMRYVIALDEKGRWSEDGSMSTDGGKNWFPFFHMTLEKIGE